MFSVLMSVYQSESPSFLDEAIRSVWDDQTQKPSQIVIVKDGPLTRELDSVIGGWSERLGDILTLVSLKENKGLGAALNAGMEKCSYDLVARMDTDDRAVPDRFELQYAFMKQSPEIAASSGLVEEWDESFERRISVRKLPTESSELFEYAKRRCPLSHPAVMFRKSVVQGVGGYPELRKAQDYALWSMLLVNSYSIANIDACLVKMRAGRGMMQRRGSQYLLAEFRLLRFQRRIGFIGFSLFMFNFLVRSALRLSPNTFKAWMYRKFR
ncbi:glycosyltransferase [Saccharospirillum mangrovi]|uniref:glycosyltransferase n=1 Tax=Saccharospirillum mangrovi TaxID=2161747 RepID=UPI0018E4EC36|nr:glycosyltransferase [Saccharospirillum mangrovi]